ncbi:nuclear transport factor 2 family protein [Microbulbifer sp. SA54]|uniref:nuclear transport factor 2 family protein n=1 Tax=Microbulbifer sp. SA54 TaxID=3401577 RepID=UPI003AAE7973
MERLDRLQLEADLRANYYRYAEGLDNKDWQQVRDCFAEEVFLDYGPIVDPGGSPDQPRPADDWVATLQRNIGGFDLTRHTICNHRVEVDGENVRCTAYLVADHIILQDSQMPIAGPDNIATVVGEYTNQYRHVGGEWKIFRSRLDIKWSSGNIALFQQAAERFLMADVIPESV